jgi:hypothetical protein
MLTNTKLVNKAVEDRMVIRFTSYNRAQRIICKDGFSMSVQAGEGIYSQPRMDNCFPYNQFEVGFPSAKPYNFREYAEFCGTEDYTDTVYPYVPADLIGKEIRYHGGLMKIAVSRNKREGTYTKRRTTKDSA